MKQTLTAYLIIGGIISQFLLLLSSCKTKVDLAATTKWTYINESVYGIRFQFQTPCNSYVLDTVGKNCTIELVVDADSDDSDPLGYGSIFNPGVIYYGDTLCDSVNANMSVGKYNASGAVPKYEVIKHGKNNFEYIMRFTNAAAAQADTCK